MAPLRKSSRVQSETDEGGVGIFPTELLIVILSWLPVTSLMRFKSISKCWYSLITSPDFLSLHLQRSLEESPTRSFLFLRESSTWYSVEMDNLMKLDTTAKVAHPQCNGTQIVGSCNGLLCMWTLRNGASLYNPSTPSLHELPSLPYDWPAFIPEFPLEDGYNVSNHMRFGFGYNNISHDYKVWRMCLFYADVNNSPFIYSGKVYSLKTNSWRKIQNFPDNVGEIDSDGGALCNESLHWACSFRPEGAYCYHIGILGFELHSETYRQVPVPDHGFSCCEMSLGVLDKCLCATFLSLSGGGFSMWVMKEYGVKESWTKLFSISLAEIRDQMEYCSRHVRPLAFFKSGDEILLDTSGVQFHWYDLRNARIKGFLSYQHSDVDICVQSFVSPKSGSLIGRVEQ